MGKRCGYFKSQPGLISAQLLRGIGGSGEFVNYAVWESTALFKKALNKINLEELLLDYPTSTVVTSHIQESCSTWNLCGRKRNKISMTNGAKGHLKQIDIAILGGGPAGLQAALVLSGTRKKIIVFDDPEPQKPAPMDVIIFLV